MSQDKFQQQLHYKTLGKSSHQYNGNGAYPSERAATLVTKLLVWARVPGTQPMLHMS